ncbi:MAG: hypothetical protein AB8B69_14640, partial [Chitinophagales bacterium]
MIGIETLLSTLEKKLLGYIPNSRKKTGWGIDLCGGGVSGGFIRPTTYEAESQSSRFGSISTRYSTCSKTKIYGVPYIHEHQKKKIAMRSKDKMISGFSKLGKREKIAWLLKHFFTSNPIEVTREFASFWHTNEEAQNMFDGISENTITNFYMPFGVAPNFMIDGKLYCVPMVIEESSVVAAASSGAKFWLNRGGFHTDIVSTVKSGHVHFMWHGETYKFLQFFDSIRADLRFGVKDLTRNMEKRGGGIKGIELLHRPEIESGYYQIKVDFETCDAMGANFINSVLESFGKILKEKAKDYFEGKDKDVNVIMAILSNYTPECLVRAWVECPIEDLGNFPNDISAKEFAYKFNQAIHIARNDHFRATTHNKGIF